MTQILSARETEGRTENQEFVTFSLNNEMYAISALNVQEIIELTSITKVPHLPYYFKGVINLRGNIIPVVDLKHKFGMTSEGYRRHTCIIVTEFSGGIMGLVVDAVSDVLHISEELLLAPPSFGVNINTDFIKGMGKVNDNLVIVLDVERVLTEEEVSIISEQLTVNSE